MKMRWTFSCGAFVALMAASSGLAQVYATVAPETVERAVGPYNVHVLQGGSSLTRTVPATSEMLKAAGVYTLSLFVRMEADVPANTLFAGVGDATAEDSRYLGLRDGRPMLRLGRGVMIEAPAPLPRTGWHALAAVYDGVSVRLYVDGREVAQGSPALGPVTPELVVAPSGTHADRPEHTSANPLEEEGYAHFGGDLAAVTLAPVAPSATDLRSMMNMPDPSLLRFDEASPAWPVQTHAQAGYMEQQDPSLMPVSRAPLGKALAKPLPRNEGPALVDAGKDTWNLRNRWSMIAAPETGASAEAISSPGFDSHIWMRATVPGTVLTTLVDRGVYPDPDFGLNNLAIPESLNKQDYWYRIEFETPATDEKRFALTFNGINYAAEVWLNGKRIGDVQGAFIRGRFDVTDALRAVGSNALAVRISPPPHPGIPQEQSLKGGPGENGGAMELDGPTFVATEGWDWIPAIRDRNSGIWQDVMLTSTGQLRLGDPQVITKLPLPDTRSADVTIEVPMTNTAQQPIEAKLRASFEGVVVEQSVQLTPGQTMLTLSPAEFKQLHLLSPRLWWPNGYGKPELYHLRLALETSGAESDHRDLTFGVREVSYELSLFDRTGRLRRVEVLPTEARLLDERVVDVTHEGMRRREAEFAAASLTAAGEHSAAVRAVPNEQGLTDLVLRVNGVRIAARGGNWGMDDSRKRVSREHLQPFFRLQREANLNIIRNWVGQDTEETFYELADENGMMVWNDFWESTQDYNVEAEDVPLFVRNVRDVVQRFRNHPSIVIWCGRNEGVPQPVLNRAIIDVVQGEDGTRYYTPGSNRINLRNSGPYHYQDPALYFNTLDKGFSVELGIASLSTLESLKASMAPADLWPISDAWAYHDFHWSGNGDVHPLLEAMDRQLGAWSNLEEFERKSQIFNYVDHRAIFEGFNQHLWQPNSGRLLWMTHPAWPSNMWQIYDSDTDTNASYYGVKKSCEPLHVQLELSDDMVAGVNTTVNDAGMVKVRAGVYSLSNSLLFEQYATVSLPADGVVPVFKLALGPLFQREDLLLVKLEMTDASGKVLSQNLYWLATKDVDYRKLDTLAPAKLATVARSHRDGEETVVDLRITNAGPVPALQVKATLKDAVTGQRILPAYYSDNYLSLLAGESADLTIRYSTGQAATVALRGWNLESNSVNVRMK